MTVRRKLKFLIPGSMSLLLLAVAANAAVDAETPDDNITTGSVPPLSNELRCVDLHADCNTLMVNYSGDSVQFALFQRGGSKDASGDADDSSNRESPAVNNLPDGQLLGIDFLRGLKDRSDASVLEADFSDEELDSAQSGAMHDWAFAAASMDNMSSQSSPSDARDFADGSKTVWDFDYVYLWEVDVNVLDSGGYDLSQVALSDIYLSPKTNSTSDPGIVVCEMNDSTNCRPLSD